MNLRKLRICLATLAFLGITGLFLDFTGTLHAWLGILAKVQFLPALLALNVVVLVGILLLTLLFGRIYCSILCPLGVLQDIISHLAGKFKRFRFSYTPPKNLLRVILLGVILGAFITGFSSIVAILAPYSAYGRIASNLLAPVYMAGNNVLAMIAEHYESYAFYHVDIWIKSGVTFAIASITLLIVALLAARSGRTYCNTICPVGTLLGLFAKFAIFKVRVDTSKCNSCGLCARNCKANCIDVKSHTIDATRCVSCFDCITTCKKDALSYGLPQKKEQVQETTKPASQSISRKAFLSSALLFAAGGAHAAVEEKTVDGGYATILPKHDPARQHSIKPAGAQSLRNFESHCTGCQLCVSACPNNVLKPSKDAKHWMQPEMSFADGYCRPECTRCSEVCPAGAIQKITAIEKSSIQIGHAVWHMDRCIVKTEGVTCGNCSRHCPNGAIQLVALNGDEKFKVPAIDTERCLGCGACENLCPVRPLSAITVEGHEIHRTI